ncbi:MAG: hypothetical protein ACK559_16045, partial [bacterium]
SVPKTTVPVTDKPNDLPKLKKFVDSWPENKPYLNKSGNALSAEFEKAFGRSVTSVAIFHTKAKIVEYIRTRLLFLPYVQNVDKVFMTNVSLDESSTLNRMLINCIIFKEMV